MALASSGPPIYRILWAQPISAAILVIALAFFPSDIVFQSLLNILVVLHTSLHRPILKGEL
jgi:hypothetical protein